MRAKSDAHIKRPVQMQLDRRPELVHRLPVEAHENRELVTMLLDPDALRSYCHEAILRGTSGTAAAAAHAELHVLDAHIALRPPRQVHHTRPVQRHHRSL